MQHAKIDPDDAVFEPYYRAPDGADPSWHPISQSPYTTPKVSSITITWIDPLDEWESYWSEKHQEHVYAGDYDPAKARFGPLPDPDETGHSSYELESGRYLQACCGTERPVYEQTKLLVEATGDFVTIHDFISVVHPYLMARRGEIVAAMREEQYRGSPVPAETDMMVTLTTPTSLYVTDQSEWLEYHQKPRKVVHDPATQARLAIFDAKIRAAGLGRPGATSS